MGNAMRRARETVLAGGQAPGVRRPILDSWLRARRVGLRADTYLPPVALTDGDLERRRREHPLTSVWPVLRHSMRWATTEPGHMLFVSDAEGHLLWVEGERASVRAAERVHLLPGARWSEDAAGTSAVGTALALQRSFQVLGAEHFLSAAVDFTCTAAPIRHPVTGDLLGTVDLTCRSPDSGALAYSLLSTAARLVETTLLATILREEAIVRARYMERVSRRLGTRSAIVAADGHVLHADPPSWLPRWGFTFAGEGVHALPDGRSLVVERLGDGGTYLVVERASSEASLTGLTLRFEGLGRDRGRLRIAGVEHRLSRRHSEIVVALLAHPEGLTAAELTRHVYGRSGKATTLRAELARLRPVLGHHLVSGPYRLVGECSADFLDPPETGSAAPNPAGVGRGPLLPTSDAPAVRAIRDRADSGRTPDYRSASPPAAATPMIMKNG